MELYYYKRQGRPSTTTTRRAKEGRIRNPSITNCAGRQYAYRPRRSSNAAMIKREAQYIQPFFFFLTKREKKRRNNIVKGLLTGRRRFAPAFVRAHEIRSLYTAHITKQRLCVCVYCYEAIQSVIAQQSRGLQ